MSSSKRTSLSGEERLATNMRGLVSALRRHGPQDSWSIAEHRGAFESAAANRDIARDVAVSSVQTSGGPAEWLKVGTSASNEVVLYLHGGGFIMGSSNTTRPLASHLASQTRRDVMVLEYDLSPESVHPIALSQVVACFKWLLEQGYSADAIVLAGDSAGAGLALAATLELRSAALPMPAALILLSPLLDLRLVADSIDENSAFDPQTPRWLLDCMVRSHLGSQTSPEDPKVSPLLANLSGLPPTLVQVAELEALLDDATAFHDKASAAGSPVEIQVWPGVIHVWHAFVPRLSQALDALEAVGVWLDQRSGRSIQ